MLSPVEKKCEALYDEREVLRKEIKELLETIERLERQIKSMGGTGK